jgi:N-ATPase, AtpR subunit
MIAFCAWAAAGFGLGLAYFAALRRSVDCFAGGNRIAPALLTLGRIAGIAVLLGLSATVGALPLLLAFLGFLGARTLAVRTARRSA